MIFVHFQAFNQVIRRSVKYMITLHIPKLFLKKFTFFLLYIRMSKRNINFDGKKIKRSEFYKNKNVTEIDKIDVNKTLVSKEEPCRTKNSFKYFMGYNDNDVIRPLCIKLPQMTGYSRKFDEKATMSFKANNKQLLKRYNQIWKKVEK